MTPTTQQSTLSTPPTAPRGPVHGVTRRVALWLALLAVVVAAVPGLMGRDHPPQSINPDEWHFVPVAMKTANHPELHPKIFINPSAPIYAYTAWLGARYALGRATGDYASSTDFAFEYVVDRTPAYHWCRWLNGLAGLLAIGLLAYGTARRFGAWEGVTAGVLLGLSPLLQSKLRVAIDEPMLVLVCVCVLLTLWRARDRRSWRWFFVAALTVGLAAGTKYNGAVLGLPWLLTGWALYREGSLRLGHAIAASFLIPLGFLFTTPHAVLDWPSFSSQVIYNREQLGTDGPFWSHLGEYLVSYFTGYVAPWMWVPAVVGWWFGRRHASEAARNLLGVTVLLSVSLAVYLARGQLATPRYAFPAQPWIVVAAALGIGVLARNAFQASKARRVAFVGGVLILAGLGLHDAFAQANHASASRARFELTQWVRTHTEPGERILADWYGPLLPPTEQVERYPEQLEQASPPVHHLRRQPLYDYVRKGLNPLPGGGSPLDFDELRAQGFRLIIMNQATWTRARQPDAHPDLQRFLDLLEQLPEPVEISDSTEQLRYFVYAL